MAVKQEIWTGEVVRKVSTLEEATFLDGLPDYSRYATNNVIHMAYMGVEPKVLINGGGWMHNAPDLATLAEKAGLSAAALQETVRAYNEAVNSGRLGDLSPARSVKEHKPMPIAVAPFHAVPLCAGLTLGMGGIAINAHAQALRTDGSIIPGLYVAGTPVQGLEGGPRATYLGGLCKAFTLGLLAGEHIALSI